MEDLVIIWQNREQKEKETSQYLEQRILLVHLPPQEFQNISIQLAYHVAQEIHSYELQILQTTYEEGIQLPRIRSAKQTLVILA